MDKWKKEMITTIMDSDKSLAETIAMLIDQQYEDESLYLDELASEIYAYDSSNAEELKDWIENEIDLKGDK